MIGLNLVIGTQVFYGMDLNPHEIVQNLFKSESLTSCVENVGELALLHMHKHKKIKLYLLNKKPDQSKSLLSYINFFSQPDTEQMLGLELQGWGSRESNSSLQSLVSLL